MRDLRPALNAVEAVLLLAFLVHIFFTITLLIENIRARGLWRYAVDRPVGERTLASRLIPVTGAYILGFVVWHLLDFTFIDQHGPRGFINGVGYEVYGVVYNAFKDVRHSGAYILAVCFLGFHLAHGVQSFIQTLGFEHPVWSPRIRVLSLWAGWLAALAFSSIPLYVLFYVKF